MKNLLFLFCILLGTSVLAKDISVGPGGDVKAAIEKAANGDRVLIAAGTYTVNTVQVPVGVSIIGAGQSQTVLKFQEFSWWKGSLLLYSSVTTSGNQEICSLTMDGQKAKAFEGITIHNRTHVSIHDITITGFFNAGIQVAGSQDQKSASVEIYNFNIAESSRENGSGSMGNIMLSGNVDSLIIHDGTITHLTNYPVGQYGDKSSGGGIKARPYYAGSTEVIGTISNSKILRVTFKSKPTAPWAGNLAPNITIEFWRCIAKLVEIAYCHLPTSVSLEYNASVSNQPTFWVHDNTFVPQTGQAMELATPYCLIENNRFDMTQNANAWGVIGNYNSDTQITGITIRKNMFLLAATQPHIYRTTARLRNWRFENNTIRAANKILVMEVCRANSDGSDGIYITGNQFQNGFTDFAYTDGSSGVRPTNVVISDTVPEPFPVPVLQPVTLYDSVYVVKDTVSKSFIIRYKTVKR